MFVDTARIFIKAGNGGNGCTSFYTEKYVNNGGPDGGNGGEGGSVIFRAAANKNTLADFKYAKHFRADNGENGKSRYSAGKKGKDLVIDVPGRHGDQGRGNGRDHSRYVCRGTDCHRCRRRRGGAATRSSVTRAARLRFSQAGERADEHACPA